MERKTVSYKNRYGMELVGELYTAKNMDVTEKHPAIIVGTPYGGVKEQGPCVYANELAQCDVRIKAVATCSMYDMSAAGWT